MAEIADAAVEIHGDTAPFDRDMDRAVRKARRAGDKAGEEFTEAQRDSLGRFTGKAGEAGGKAGESYGARFKKAVRGANIAGTLGAALTMLASNAIYVGGALAPLTGLLAGLPGVLSIGAAAMGTLSVATAGMGAAFEAAASGDVEKFNEALKGLSPAAQGVAREFAALVPRFNEIKNAVQDAMFAPLAGDLTRMANVLAGPVQAGMTGVAAEMGNAGSAIADFVAQGQTASVVNEVFAATRQTIAGITPALAPLLAGIRDLISATVGGMGGMGSAIASVMTSFGQWLSQISQSGQAMEWITAGVEALRQLGTVVMNVGGVVVGMFRAMSTVAGGTLSTFAALTGELNRFVNSAQGQEALVSMFTAITVVGGTLQGVLGAVLSALAPIVAAAGRLVVSLGPALEGAVAAFSGMLTVLAPVGAAIDLLASAIGSINPAVLSAVGAGIMTIVVAHKALAYGTTIWNALKKAAFGYAIAQRVVNAAMRANPIGIIITVIAGLVAAFIWLWNNVEGFRNFWLSVWGGIQAAASAAADWIVGAWNAVTSFFAALPGRIGAWLTAVGQWFLRLPGMIGSAIMSLLTTAGSMLASLGQLIWSGLVSAGQAVLNFFMALPGRIGAFLMRLPMMLWTLFVNALTFAARAVGFGIGLIIALVVLLPWKILQAVIGLGPMLWGWAVAAWNWARNAFVTGIAALVRFAMGLPGRIITGLVVLGAMLWTWAVGAWNRAIAATGAAINRLLAWSRALPGRVIGAISALGSMLWSWATGAWNRAVTATVSAITRLASFARSLPGRVIGAISALGSMLWSWATGAWNRAVAGTKAGASAIWSFVRSIPGRIVSALGNLGSLLYGAGKSIITGFLNGLKSAIGGVMSFVGGIAGKIASLKGPITYDRVLLTPHGKAIIGGLDTGLRRQWPQVRRTLRDMTAEVESTSLTPRLPSGASTPDLAAAQRLGGVVNRQRTSSRTVNVDAPITVSTNTTSPAIAARQTADRLAAMAEG